MLKPATLPWRGIAIVLAVACLSLAIKVYQLSATLGGVFNYDCTIRAIDSETHTRLTRVSIGWDGPRNTEPFQRTCTATGLPDGSMRFSGMDFQPTVFRIDSDGYLESEITVTRNSPHEFEIPLKRKAAKNH